MKKNAGKFSPAPGRNAGLPGLTGQTKALLSGPGAKARSWVQDLDEGRLDPDILHAIGAGRPLDLDLVRSASGLPSLSPVSGSGKVAAGLTPATR